MFALVYKLAHVHRTKKPAYQAGFFYLCCSRAGVNADLRFLALQFCANRHQQSLHEN